MKFYVYDLVVRANGDVRVRKGSPSGRRRGLRLDEVAFPIKIRIPDGWGAVQVEQEIRLQLPPPPQVEKDPK